MGFQCYIGLLTIGLPNLENRSKMGPSSPSFTRAKSDGPFPETPEALAPRPIAFKRTSVS